MSAGRRNRYSEAIFMRRFAENAAKVARIKRQPIPVRRKAKKKERSR